MLAADNRPSGFDYMRLLLALSVIAFHSIVTSYGMGAQKELLASAWRAPLATILPMFFALSGFLVAGSFERSKWLVSFLGLRVLRIVPALAVEVLISALILGSVFTILPLADYVSDPKFANYFLNILGHIQYELPGVFLDNPNPETVNGQLWTVPWELVCYILCAGLALFKIFARRHLLALLVVGCYGAYFVKLIYTLFFQEARIYQVGGLAGHTLVMVFATGLLFYRYRDKIIYSRALFLVSLLASFALLAIPPHGDGFVALPITYVTVYLGLMNPTRHRLLLSGDYSYGLFLYGYPIQQTVASFVDLRHAALNILITVPVVTLLAVFSWWCIEKPSLSLRRYLKQSEEWYLRRKGQKSQ